MPEAGLQGAHLLKAGVGEQALPARQGAPEREVALVLKAPALRGQAPEHGGHDVREVVEAQEAARRQHLRHVRQRAWQAPGSTLCNLCLSHNETLTGCLA